MKKVTALIMSAVMMLCVCSACGTKKEQVNSPQQASNSTETKTEEHGSDVPKLAEETKVVSYLSNLPFVLNDYIYYFSDAYFENNEFSFEGERYNSLYRMDKNGNSKEKVYSGTDIGVYNFGYADGDAHIDEYREYAYNDCVYIIDNIHSGKPKKIIRVSLSTGKCESLFENILSDESVVCPDGDGIEIYKDGLFYLKKGNAKTETSETQLWYSSTDGKTSLVCDGVKEYCVLGNRLWANTEHGITMFNAESPYEEVPTFEFISDRPIRTDTTGKIAVSYRSLDSGENEMYKYDIDSGDETALRTGYICACKIVSDVIIFTEYKDGKCDVYQMNLNGENVKQLS